jgi:hypothetical protein
MRTKYDASVTILGGSASCGCSALGLLHDLQPFIGEIIEQIEIQLFLFSNYITGNTNNYNSDSGGTRPAFGTLAAYVLEVGALPNRAVGFLEDEAAAKHATL